MMVPVPERTLVAFIAVPTLTMAPSNVVVKRMPLP
jgi:hypothetical protein